MEPFAKLKVIRTENKLTQSQVATALGITRSAYCGYEIGRRKMSTEMLKKLAEFYRLPITAFFDGSVLLNDNEHYGNNEMYLSSLSEEERVLVVKYRILNEKSKKRLINAVEEYKNEETEQK